MRFLVAGGAGFIGSHLCDALVSEGKVIAVDSLVTGKIANLEHLRNEPRFEFVEQDICVPLKLKEIDYVFNFASPASPADYLRYGPETLRTGAEGTRNLLELVRETGAQFLQASTSECYGDPLEHPQRETYWGNVNPIGPRSVYDEAKRFAEALTMAYHRYKKVDTKIVRIFNTYGPRLQLNDGRVISNFMKQALRGEDLTVYGDGCQTRSFCFVSDEVDGILRLARSQENYPVNIGNATEFTILDCAKLVLRVTKSASALRFLPLPQDDPKQRRPDIGRARQILHWEPAISLEEGLRLSLPYFKKVVEGELTAAVGRGSSS